MEGIAKSGAGQILVPLAMGAASVLAPRAASGLASGLSLMTHMGEINRRREQAQSLRDLMGGGSIPGVDPNVAKAVPDEALPSFLGHAMTMNQPQRWPTSIGDQQGFVEAPRTAGATPTFVPVGPKSPPPWGEAHRAKAYAMGFGTTPTPEQMGQVQEALKQEQLDKEQRGLEKSFSLQDRLYANAQARQNQGYTNAATERDITAGRNDYNKITSGYRTSLNKLEAEYQKQFRALHVTGGQPALPKDQYQKAKDELSTWKLQQTGQIQDEMLAQFDDWKDTYQHVLPYLPGLGGMPKAIQRIRGSGVAPTNDKPWLNME